MYDTYQENYYFSREVFSLIHKASENNYKKSTEESYEFNNLVWVSLGSLRRMPGSSKQDRQLNEILKDFNSIEQEATEEGLNPPSEKTINLARKTLKEIYEILPVRYEVYPLEEGSVAIDVTVRPGQGILIIFEGKGSVVCFVSIDGKNRRARYDEANHFPKGFIDEALKELKVG